MTRSDYIGLRVARWRDLAGMTQQQLADAAGITREYVSMIENGRRAVTKRDLALKLAHGIGVDVNDLTGQPYPPIGRADLALHTAAPSIRLALDGETDPGAPRPLDGLKADAESALVARMSCDYPRLCTLLPELITQTVERAESNREDVRRDALSVFVKACVTGCLTIKPHGWIDLGLRLAERADVAARAMDDPEHIGAARYALSQALLAGGSLRSALVVATSAADELEPHTGQPACLEWYGMLHLQSALASASLANGAGGETARSAMNEHMDEAAAAALRAQSSPWRMEFTPPNVGLWRVGIALENGEPDRAPGYARRVDRASLRTLQRRVRLLIDTGRAEYQVGNYRAAVRLLLAADDTCPAEVRPRTTIREIVGQMVRDARERGGWAELRTLATRLRIDPLSDHPGTLPFSAAPE